MIIFPAAVAACGLFILGPRIHRQCSEFILRREKQKYCNQVKDSLTVFKRAVDHEIRNREKHRE